MRIQLKAPADASVRHSVVPYGGKFINAAGFCRKGAALFKFYGFAIRNRGRIALLLVPPDQRQGIGRAVHAGDRQGDR